MLRKVVGAGDPTKHKNVFEEQPILDQPRRRDKPKTHTPLAPPPPTKRIWYRHSFARLRFMIHASDLSLADQLVSCLATVILCTRQCRR